MGRKLAQGAGGPGTFIIPERTPLDSIPLDRLRVVTVGALAAGGPWSHFCQPRRVWHQPYPLLPCTQPHRTLRSCICHTPVTHPLSGRSCMWYSTVAPPAHSQ